MNADDTITLYRPVGPDELALIRDSGFRRFPPRLPQQPIFYPVLSESYATKIARDWNVRASGAGYVTRFAVLRSFLDRYFAATGFPLTLVSGGLETSRLRFPFRKLDHQRTIGAAIKIEE